MAMPISLLFLFFAIMCLTFTSFITSTPSLQQDPNASRRRSHSPRYCRRRLNPIDNCWRNDPNWNDNRKKLSECAMGFGRKTYGGWNTSSDDLDIYVVTDSGNDNATTPNNGTLRYGVIQDKPLWITFQNDMTIQLKEELIINSYKTLDGRGSLVEIAHGPCITIQGVTQIIIHNIHIHNCVPAGNTNVRSSEEHSGYRTECDGDGISILNSTHVWVDHCTMSNCADGLIDVVLASNSITISNNWFYDHNEVMLLGHNDSYVGDKRMHVTVAYNRFGEGLFQRMPRCRFGYFHVVNNDYSDWLMYAIGGSAAPTILSQGNRFTASENSFTKQVTKHLNADDSVWKHWNWMSDDDLMINGSYFISSGSTIKSDYNKAMSLKPCPQKDVEKFTRDAGILTCTQGKAC